MDTTIERPLHAWAARYARRTAPLLTADDLMQEARVRIWRDDITDPGLAITCGRRAMIDAIRRDLGRIGQPRATGNQRTDSYDAWTHEDGSPMDPFAVTGRTSPSAESVALARIQGQEALSLVDERTQDLLISLSEGETLASIGARYGVTEARMCQVRGKATARIRRKVAA